MIFNSNIFLFCFLPVVFSLFWAFRSKQSRYLLLTVSGYVFYGYWNWKFCFLLFFSSMVSYVTALLMDRNRDRHGTRPYLLVSIGVDLGLLGFFKYYNFFAATLGSIGRFPPPLLEIVLPIGISFYTFHTISYIVDVADRRVKPARNLFEYFTYVCLFSQLVAGPIVRYRQIEEDLENIDGPPREDWIARGLGFFVTGLIKKAIIADQIAAYVNPLLQSYDALSMAGAWAAALGYALQLYYDFSGYSDMAVGLGYLFGLRIPQNFAAPYRAAGIRDFWRRWHISLSTWLRDYLYIRLGGNRRGAFRTDLNLMITMLLGGLWHGANWTFVIWGGYHGALLILDRSLERFLRKLPAAAYRALTFVLVLVGWVLFRSDSMPMALVWLSKMAGFGAGELDAPRNLAVLLALGMIAVNTMPETWDIRFGVRRRWAVAYAAAFFLAYLFVNGRQTVFLYYQF